MIKYKKVGEAETLYIDNFTIKNNHSLNCENHVYIISQKVIEDINTDYGYDYKKKTRIFIGKQSMENLIKHVFPLRLISLSLWDINISNEEKLKMLDSTYDTMKNRKDIVPIWDKDWKKIENDYSYHKRHIEVPVSIERSIN